MEIVAAEVPAQGRGGSGKRTPMKGAWRRAEAGSGGGVGSLKSRRPVRHGRPLMPGQTYSHIGSLGRTGGGSGRRTQAKVGLASSAVEAVSNSADRFIRSTSTALATSAGPLRRAISAAGATTRGGSLQGGAGEGSLASCREVEPSSTAASLVTRKRRCRWRREK